MSRPHRRYEIALVVHGDDWDAAIQQLRHMAEHVEEHGEGCGMVSGGYDSGGHVHIAHDPEQTHEGYIAELEAWREARRTEET